MSSSAHDSSGQEAPARRIAVAFDAVEFAATQFAAIRQSITALETAAELGSWLRAELVGVFIEDLELLRAAELPFAHEIGGRFGLTRPLSRQQLEQQFQQRAAAARQALATIAERSQLRWEFRVLQGTLTSGMEVLSAEAELILLELRRWSPTVGVGRSSAAPRHPRWAPPTVPPSLRRLDSLGSERPIVVLFAAGPAAEASLRVAGELAQRQRRPLLVVVPPSLTAAPAVAGLSVPVQRLRWPSSSPAELTQLLATLQPALLVVPVHHDLLQRHRSSEALQALDCTVAIVRS